MTDWEDIVASIKKFVVSKSDSTINKVKQTSVTLPWTRGSKINVTTQWVGDDPLDVVSLIVRFGDDATTDLLQQGINAKIVEDVSSIIDSMDDSIRMKFVSTANNHLRSTICIMDDSILQVAYKSDCLLKIHRAKIDEFSWCKFPGMYGGRETDDLTKMFVQGIHHLKWKCVKGLGHTKLAKKMERFALIRHEDLGTDAVESVLRNTAIFTLDDIQEEVKLLASWNEDTIKPNLQAFMSYLGNILVGYEFGTRAFVCPNHRRFMAEVEISGRFGWGTGGRSMFDNMSICWREWDGSVYEGNEKCSSFELCPELEFTSYFKWCTIEFVGNEVVVESKTTPRIGDHGYKGITQLPSIINRSVYRVLELGETIAEERIKTKTAVEPWLHSLSAQGLECKKMKSSRADAVYVITRAHNVHRAIKPVDKSNTCYFYLKCGDATFSPTAIYKIEGLQCAACSKQIGIE